MFLNTDNIGYALEVLITLTAIIVIVIFYMVIKIKINKKKTTIKTNMFKQNIDKEENVTSEYLDRHMDEENQKKEKGVSIHLNKKDIKKINNFKIGGISLLKQSLLKNDIIVNGDLQGKPNLFSINDFYFNIHKYINKLFIEGVFNITKEELFDIQKTLGKLNLNLLKNKIIEVALNNNLIDNKDKGLLFFKKIIIGAISNDNYLLLRNEEKEKYSSKINKLKNILEKKNISEKELTSEEEEILEIYDREKEIQKEINRVLKNKIKVNLLSFDITSKELYILIDFNDLLNKSLKDLVAYYSKKKNLNNIIFYI